MGKNEEEQARSFKVEDRRRFVEGGGGEARDEPAPQPEQPRDTGDAPEASRGTDATGELSEMTFSTFVMGLTTQALMHLGEIADPLRKETGRDLPAAKQMIDLLGILREKTKGNLDPTEDQLLGTMLYDLRMRYVEVSRTR